MKTATAERAGGRCPGCGARLSADVKGRGWVRHLEYRGPCRHAAYGQHRHRPGAGPDGPAPVARAGVLSPAGPSATSDGR